MDVFEAICSRRSIREYKDKPVEREKLGRMLEAARWTPSAGNMQTWEFIIVDEPAKKEKLAQLAGGQHFIADAPATIIVLSDVEKAGRHFDERGKNLYALQESAICLQNMMLEAHNQGLGTTWVGDFDEHQIRVTFDVPENVRPVALLTVGYPDEEPRTPSKYRVSFVTSINEYGNRVNPVYDRFVWRGLKHYAEEAKQDLEDRFSSD
jgi:nitroreductase